MAEYISKDQLHEITKPFKDSFLSFLTDEIDRLVDTMKPADVQPVKHGRWIDGDCRCVTAVCSNCNRLRLGNGAKSAMRLALYCEKCGARMDGET